MTSKVWWLAHASSSFRLSMVDYGYGGVGDMYYLDVLVQGGGLVDSHSHESRILNPQPHHISWGGRAHVPLLGLLNLWMVTSGNSMRESLLLSVIVTMSIHLMLERVEREREEKDCARQTNT